MRPAPTARQRTSDYAPGMAITTISGEAWMRERMLLPSDSILTVEVLDRSTVVAATAIEGSPPTAFALALDEARVGDPEDLRVRATLRSASGTWWTPEAVADWDRVLLVRVADADDQPLVDVPV